MTARGRRGLDEGEGPDWLNAGQALSFPGKFLEPLDVRFHEKRRFHPPTSIKHQEAITDIAIIKLLNESFKDHSNASSLLARLLYA